MKVAYKSATGEDEVQDGSFLAPSSEDDVHVHVSTRELDQIIEVQDKTLTTSPEPPRRTEGSQGSTRAYRAQGQLGSTSTSARDRLGAWEEAGRREARSHLAHPREAKLRKGAVKHPRGITGRPRPRATMHPLHRIRRLDGAVTSTVMIPPLRMARGN